MNKTVKTVLITILVMLAICGCLALGTFFGPGIVRSIQMKPAYKLADAFMNDLQAGNLEDAFTRVSEDLRQNAGSAEALPAYLGILSPIESFDRGSMSMISSDRQDITVTYSARLADQTEVTLWVKLGKTEAGWEISQVSVHDK